MDDKRLLELQKKLKAADVNKKLESINNDIIELIDAGVTLEYADFQQYYPKLTGSIHIELN